MPNLLTPTILTIALIAINLIAFAAFGVDKAKARAGRWRVQESTLLLFAFLGGTIGPFDRLRTGAASFGTRPASSRSIPNCSGLP